MSPDRLQIHLLGPLEVSRGGTTVELPPSRKARALLAYLVAVGRSQTRSGLCDLFWQDVNDPRAGLRWALSKLRAVVDDDECRRIVTPRDQVNFDSSRTEVDLHRVRSTLDGGGSEATTEALQNIGRMFRGEFLEDLDLPGCHRYQAWCLGMRERLRSTRISIYDSLVERLREDPREALPHALARLNFDPFSEDAYITAMELLADLGRVDRGMELYERCRRMLADHLNLSPSPDLEAVRRRLQDPSLRRPKERGSDGEPEDRAHQVKVALNKMPAPEHLPEPNRDDTPLVGRKEEMEVLRDLAARATSAEPSLVGFLTGEPGIGKTRLLRELVGEVRSTDGWVLSGPVFESEEIRPYGPWMDMLRSLPPSVLDHETRRGLRGLLSKPGEEPRIGDPVERAQLFDEMAELLRRMTEIDAPGVVILDDIQWLDPSSAALLHYVSRTLESEPLVFVLAARREEIGRGSRVARVVRSLDGAGQLRQVPLRRLDASETSLLVQAVDRALDPSLVFDSSEGNPLFALALATSLRDGIERFPSTVEEELDDRLDRLDPQALSLLPWAAALGRAFDVPTLVYVLDRPAHEVVEAIDLLERRGILRAAGKDRYDFDHSLLRDAAYRRPSEPARRAIHRSIAETLDTVDQGEGRAPGAVAHHAELGGLPHLAARAYQEAADDSLWLFAFDETAELVERGLAQVAELPDEARIPLEMDLLRLYTFRNMEDRRPTDLEERVRNVTEEARNLGLNGGVATGHALLMELAYQRGAFAEAGQSSVRSAEAGRRSEPLTAIRSLAETAACLLILDQAPEDARRLSSEAGDLAREWEVEMDVLALAQALQAHHDGNLDQASRGFREVIRLGRRARDRWWECPAMTRMVMVELDRGNPQKARSRVREALVLAERLNDEAEAAFARALEAVASGMSALGKEEEQERALEEVDATLEELETLDSLWMAGHVQAYAAEVELDRGRPDAARSRAETTLEAARTLQRPSLLALARGLLAHGAVLEGKVDDADRDLASPEVTRPYHRLSHRARTVVERAREAMEGS